MLLWQRLLLGMQGKKNIRPNVNHVVKEIKSLSLMRKCGIKDTPHDPQTTVASHKN